MAVALKAAALAFALTAAFGANAAMAAPVDLTFTGTFLKDNDVLKFNFTLTEARDVTIFSSSWDDGGFDPILSLWNSSGNLIESQDDGHNIGSTLVNGVSYTHGNWDSYYTRHLEAGSYIVAITQYDNFNKSSLLSDGFEYDDNPNFTFDLGYGPQPFFNGVDSVVGRTGDWTFHVLNVDSAIVQIPGDVPEPATIALIGAGLAGLGAARRRKEAAPVKA